MNFAPGDSSESIAGHGAGDPFSGWYWASTPYLVNNVRVISAGGIIHSGSGGLANQGGHAERPALYMEIQQLTGNCCSVVQRGYDKAVYKCMLNMHKKT